MQKSYKKGIIEPNIRAILFNPLKKKDVDPMIKFMLKVIYTENSISNPIKDGKEGAGETKRIMFY